MLDKIEEYFGYNVKPKELEFKHWSKIPRIENMSCVITEKLDGTNGVIVIQDHKLVAVGSRNKWLSDKSKHSDNYEFYSWCNKPNRKEWLEQLSDGYYYGEYVGDRIGRTYDLKERRFYLFRWDLTDLERPDLGIYTIPFLGKVPLDVLNHAVHALKEEYQTKGSAINPEFKNVEGLVIQLADHRYKCIWSK